MGASVTSLVLLLTKDFSKLVGVAFIISAPLAWWATKNFLQQYPIRIDVPIWAFLIAGILSLTLTIIIVSSQAWKAATINPSQSLKSE